MFSPSQLAPHPSYKRHHQQNYTWDHSYVYASETTLACSPSFSSTLSYQDLTTTANLPRAHTPPALPSRISALNRRAAIVSAHLAHLTTVVKPLETTKLDALSDYHLSDMWEEGLGLGKALDAFREQMDEVSSMLEDLLLSRKRKARRALGGLQRSTGKGGGRGRGRSWELEF